MIQIVNEENCCGCGACVAVCPKQCISMKERTLGCLYPEIDNKICINCGRCEKVCPINRFPLNNDYEQSLYAAYAKDENVRNSGSSGGIFQILATKLFADSYTVYGAAFDQNLQLKCTVAEKESDLKYLLKSKYLQSSMQSKFEEIKDKLNRNQRVMFCSTPCQVAALKSYLNTEYENLFTVDFFCHGVPSQRFFDECIAFDEKHKYKGKVIRYTFREKKKKGSTPHYYSCDYKTKQAIKHSSGYYFDSTFYTAFQKYICLRESCYNCIFSGRDRHSDITIGDFHDVNKYIDGINRFDGVSTVIINTEKGSRLFKSCEKEINVFPVDIEKLIEDKIIFSGCTKRPEKRNEFIKEYNENGIKGLYRKYLNPKFYLLNRIYYSMPKFIRKIMNR